MALLSLLLGALYPQVLLPCVPPVLLLLGFLGMLVLLLEGVLGSWVSSQLPGGPVLWATPPPSLMDGYLCHRCHHVSGTSGLGWWHNSWNLSSQALSSLSEAQGSWMQPLLLKGPVSEELPPRECTAAGGQLPLQFLKPQVNSATYHCWERERS